MWDGHWLTSIVNPIHGTVVALDGSWLLLFARDPFQDVWRTVAKGDPAAFARAKEPDSVSIHERSIAERCEAFIGKPQSSIRSTAPYAAPVPSCCSCSRAIHS